MADWIGVCSDLCEAPSELGERCSRRAVRVVAGHRYCRHHEAVALEEQDERHRRLLRERWTGALPW